MNKTVWITGASSGIGKAAARRFLQNGYTVFAGARRTERMNDLKRMGARILYLDVTDEKSCRSFVRAAFEQTGRVDILVNNAGYGEYGPIETVSEEKAKRELDTVLFGAVRMAKLCAPLMREQKAGRIVNVISAGGRAVTYLGGWYHAAKFALEAISDSLRTELEPQGIKVVVIEPGGVSSAFGEQAAENLSVSVKGSVYEEEGEAVAEVYRRVYGGRNKMLTSPDRAAEAICKAATVKHPKTRYLFGFGARSLLTLHALLPQRTYDRLMRRMFTAHMTQNLIK